MSGSNTNQLVNPAVGADVDSLLIEKFNGVVHEQYLKGENLLGGFTVQDVVGTNIVSDKYMGETKLQTLTPGQEPEATMDTEFNKNALVVDTIVLGRNFRKLYHRSLEIKRAYPGRVRIRAWSRRVPQLLCTHHLVIGKAGGATVHEAIAARCPMLIHHLVPGQEEGNLELLRLYESGDLAATGDRLRAALQNLLADDAALWRRQKQNLDRHARPDAAGVAANFLLQLT